MPYTLQANRSTTLAAPLNMGDTSVNISSAAFTDFVGDFLIVDYDNPLKLEIIFCNCTGTSLSSIVRGQNNTSDIDHATGAKVCYGFVPGHYEALVDGTGLADGAITTAKIDDGAVTAEKIADDAIFLGKVTKTSNFSTSNTSATQVTGQSITFTIPSGGRSVEIMVMVPLAYNATAGNYVRLGVWRGTVGSGTLIDEVFYRSPSNDYGSLMCFTATDVAPPPGSTTYNLAAQSSAATAVTLRYDFTTKGGYISAKLV